MRGHGRPGTTPGRLSGRGVTAQHPNRSPGRLGRVNLHALMLDTKGRSTTLIRTLLPHPRASRGHSDQPALPRTRQRLCPAPRSTWQWRSSTNFVKSNEFGRGDRGHAAHPQRSRPARCPTRRLTRFLENRIFRALLFPTGSRLRGRSGSATQALLRHTSPRWPERDRAETRRGVLPSLRRFGRRIPEPSRGGTRALADPLQPLRAR